MVVGWISSGGDHGIHCWWDLIRSKELPSISVCHAQVFIEFSGHANSIHFLLYFVKQPLHNPALQQGLLERFLYMNVELVNELTLLIWTLNVTHSSYPNSLTSTFDLVQCCVNLTRYQFVFHFKRKVNHLKRRKYHWVSNLLLLYQWWQIVPDGYRISLADTRPKGLQFHLGHLWVGKLHHWHLCRPCIALDLAVQFKLKPEGPSPARLIRPTLHCGSMTSIVQQGSSLSSCPTFPSPNPHFNPTYESLTLCQVLSGGRKWQIYNRQMSKGITEETQFGSTVGTSVAFFSPFSSWLVWFGFFF